MYISVNVKGGLAVSTYYENADVWFSNIILPPLLFIIFAPLGGALIIQQVYKSEIEGETLRCRNTLGLKVEIKLNEVSSIKLYNIPIIPIAKIKTPSKYWSGWVSIDAAKNISVA
jgi:hypothetical protein